MTEPPIFITGCPRSGTALLRDLLRGHPRLSFPPESHFIPSFYLGYGDPGCGREAVRLAERILGLEWIRFWTLPLEPSDFAPDRSFRDVLCRLYGAWARREGKPRWGDKTPHYVRDMRLLREIFPEAKILHIIRDGRDVALSWLKSGHQPRNLVTAAELWRDFVKAGRSGGRDLPPGSFLEVRYESLLHEPEETMRRVCRVIGEPYAPSVLRPNPAPPLVRQPLLGRRKPVPRAASVILADNSGRWKNEMSRDDRARFESVAGDLLAELGYETEGLRRPLSDAARLGWRIHQLTVWGASRLNLRDAWSWWRTELEIRRARLRARRSVRRRQA